MPYKGNKDPALKKHPGANPYRGQHGFKSYFLGRKEGNKVWGVFDASRWLPHIGAKEQAKYSKPAPHRLGGKS